MLEDVVNFENRSVEDFQEPPEIEVFDAVSNEPIVNVSGPDIFDPVLEDVVNFSESVVSDISDLSNLSNLSPPHQLADNSGDVDMDLSDDTVAGEVLFPSAGEVLNPVEDPVDHAGEVFYPVGPDPADVPDLAVDDMQEFPVPEIPIDVSADSELELSSDESLHEEEEEIERAQPTPRRTRRLRRGRAFLDYAELGKPSIKRYNLFCVQNNTAKVVHINDKDNFDVRW